jgi:Pyridoxamine 5'-phosphate oxidase
MSWRELEAAAPEIARLGAARFDADGLAVLGTIRADGRPRISPVAPFLTGGELLLGVMRDSVKARDLLRDPRCVVHSAVVDPHGGAGELKLSGRAVEVTDPALRDAPAGAWWIGRPVDVALVVALAIDEAAFLSWDTEAETMTVRRWSRDHGARKETVAYP